jgi:hypothetical protein
MLGWLVVPLMASMAQSTTSAPALTAAAIEATPVPANGQNGRWATTVTEKRSKIADYAD